MMRRQPLLAAVVLFALAPPARAQEPDDSPVETTVAAVEQHLLACLVDLASTALLQQRLDRYRRSLGTRAEAQVIALLLEGLADCPPDQKPSLEGARITELLDRVSFHRRRGHPERMLPALLVLQHLLPDDARVLYALGEAYGVQSPAFDARQAEMAFAQLYEQLLVEPATPKTPRAQARELVKFLPELGGSTDRTAWLRDRVRGFCETLRDGQAIGLWKLRDPRLEELQEDLLVVLPRGVQREQVAVLEQIRAVHPDDPASCYMLAQLHASMGPEWQPARSIELFREFLDLTAEQRFQTVGDEAPLMSRDDVARRMMAMQLGEAKDQLQSLRIVAKEILIELQPAKGKPEAGLYFPEKKELERRVKELQRAQTKEDTVLRKADERIAKVRQDLAGAEADYERWKQQSARSRRGVADPQPYIDAITSRRALLGRLEEKREPLQERVAAMQAWLTACEQRLQRFTR